MKRKALITSLALLLVAIVCLSTATYAWFTTSQTASATGFAVKTVAGGGLYITAQTTNTQFADWDTSIELADGTAQFDPVSTIDCTHWFTAEADAADASATTGAYTTATGDNYFEKSVKFISTANGNLYLSGISIPSVSGAQYDLLKKSLRVGIKVGTGALKIYSIENRSTGNLGNKGVKDNGTGNDPTVESVALICMTGYTYNASDALATMTAGSIQTGTNAQTGTIYIWVEGEDAACFSLNSSGIALTDIDLLFKVA